MKDVLTRDAYKYLAAKQRRRLLKVEQAKECSGWRCYPSTCHALIERIPPEWWDKYSAEHIGAVMQLLAAAYADGRHHPDPDH